MGQLTPEMILIMALIIIAVFLFIVEWIRVDVVAILIMVTLPLLHLISPKEAFIGLSSNAVVSITAVIIIGAGLDKTGLINRLVGPIVKIAGRISRFFSPLQSIRKKRLVRNAVLPMRAPKCPLLLPKYRRGQLPAP